MRSEGECRAPHPLTGSHREEQGRELFALLPARFIEETASLISIIFLVHLFLNVFFLP